MKQSGMYAEGGTSKPSEDDLDFRQWVEETEVEIWREQRQLIKDVRRLRPDLEDELRRLFVNTETDTDRCDADVVKVRELAEKMCKHEMAKTTNSADYRRLKKERLKLWGIYIVRNTFADPPVEVVMVVPAESTMQASSNCPAVDAPATEFVSAARGIQELLDSEDWVRAKARAMFDNKTSSYRKTLDALTSEHFIKIKAERLEEKTEAEASKAYALARQRGIARASSRDTMLDVTTPKAETPTPAPAVAASDGPAPMSRIFHSTKARRDTLTPVIEQAQKQCEDPNDTAAVWAVLQVLADKKAAPLIGATEDGLQYMKSGTVAYLNRDALRKRLGR